MQLYSKDLSKNKNTIDIPKTQFKHIVPATQKVTSSKFANSIAHNNASSTI